MGIVFSFQSDRRWMHNLCAFIVRKPSDLYARRRSRAILLSEISLKTKYLRLVRNTLLCATISSAFWTRSMGAGSSIQIMYPDPFMPTESQRPVCIPTDDRQIRPFQRPKNRCQHAR